MTAQDTIPEDISTAAYNLGVDIRHHIAHSRRELFEHDPDIDEMIAKAILCERQRCAGLAKARGDRSPWTVRKHLADRIVKDILHPAAPKGGVA